MSAPQVIKNLDKIRHPVFADVIKKYCEILLQHFGERLMGVLLYGSIARGDWDRDSDIDVLVVVRGWEEKHGWDRTLELMALENRLAETEEYRRATGRFSASILLVPRKPSAPKESTSMRAWMGSFSSRGRGS